MKLQCIFTVVMLKFKNSLMSLSSVIVLQQVFFQFFIFFVKLFIVAESIVFFSDHVIDGGREKKLKLPV